MHFVGIGGIGMSALAQLLRERGVLVSGSDREDSPTTALLREKGIEVFIGQHAHQVPEQTQVVVYSDAVPLENPERAEATQRGIMQKSYFEMLGEVSSSMRTIAVAGTHGKTTTTGMLTKMLYESGEKPHAIIGSIVRDFGSNYVHGESSWLVVEACEYRNHLLELTPEALVLTNVELDHTDFFPDLDALISTFNTAVRAVPAHGVIVANVKGPHMAAVLTGAQARVVDYSQTSVPTLELIGTFNKENAAAAKTAVRELFPHINEETADHALRTFRGSWRRFECKGKTANGALVYDDYAHHPTAVEKTITGARERFPEKSIVVAFHPHLFSRTKSFLQEFAQALCKADHALVAPIYPAREKNDGTVSSALLAERARALGGDVRAASFEEIEALLNECDANTLIITMGAGDIYKVAERIVQ